LLRGWIDFRLNETGIQNGHKMATIKRGFMIVCDIAFPWTVRENYWTYI
jgi:hypothetical protein